MSAQQPFGDMLPGVLHEFAEIARDVVVELAEIDQDRAWTIAKEIALRIGEEHGSHQFYLAKGLAYHLDVRDREILAAFNGRNYEELAKLHKVSDRHVRRLVRRALAVELARRQGDMFGEREPPTRR